MMVFLSLNLVLPAHYTVFCTENPLFTKQSVHHHTTFSRIRVTGRQRVKHRCNLKNKTRTIETTNIEAFRNLSPTSANMSAITAVTSTLSTSATDNFVQKKFGNSSGYISHLRTNYYSK
jgi:hypothetical protein